MTKYLIAMGVRLICIAMCFFVQGWWLAVFAVAAVVLPYFAVILANVGQETAGTVIRPGSIVPLRPRPGPGMRSDGADEDDTEHGRTEHDSTPHGESAARPSARDERSSHDGWMTESR
jgi:hypothetical protein